MEISTEIKGLEHVVLYVRNIDRSVYFYRDVLGWNEIDMTKMKGDLRVAALTSASLRTHHELLLFEVGEDASALPRGRRVGLYHLGLKIGISPRTLRILLVLNANSQPTALA